MDRRQGASTQARARVRLRRRAEPSSWQIRQFLRKRPRSPLVRGFLRKRPRRTRSTRSATDAVPATIAVIVLKGELTSRLEGVAARAVPQKTAVLRVLRVLRGRFLLSEEEGHANARSTSARRSSTSSTPQERRTRPSVIPRWARRSGSTDA